MWKNIAMKNHAAWQESEIKPVRKAHRVALAIWEIVPMKR
jgi:hypothetical protein